MNNLEQAKLTRNNSLTSYLNQNAAVFAANVPFGLLNTKYATDYGACVAASSHAGIDNSGFSQNKLDAKIAAGQSAAALSGFAQVRFEIIGKHDMAEQLHDAETYYIAPSDAEATARLLAAFELMSNNIADLTNYVSDADLISLSDLISAYVQADGSSGAVHSASPAFTHAFKSALKATDSDIKNILKLGKFYRTSNSTFYEGLVEVCKIPPVNVHHTNVDVTVYDGANHQPVNNAVGSLSNSTKTGTSNIAGFLHIDHVASGNATLTVGHADFKPFQMLINIQRGRDNSFAINLERL